MPIKHPFVNPKADGADATVTRPSDWNADHTIEDATISPAMLDRVYSVPADLNDYQLTSGISSAAFTVSSIYAPSDVVSTHVGLSDPHTQYQLESGLSSAAYTVTSLYAISSVVVTHVALADPHTQYQLETALSSGAFQISSMYAVSTHALRHITGGADLIPSFNATSSGVVPLSGGGTANFLRADGSFAAPSGGSDPWTYIKTSSHFGTSSVTAKDIPQLSFVPGTNSTYEWESVLMLKTSTAATNPMVKIRWPTGTTSVGWVNQSQSTVTQLMVFGNQVSSLLTAVGLLGTTTGPWPCIMGGIINAFGAAGSSFGLCLRSETNGTFVSSLAGSFLKYRTY